jgi:hypothetical protein
MSESPVLDCPLDVEPELYKYNDAVIKVVQYKSTKFLDILKLFFNHVLMDPNITFSVVDVPATNSKRLSFKYRNSTTNNVLNVNDYLVVKETLSGDPYLEAIPQLTLEGTYSPMDEDIPDGETHETVAAKIAAIKAKLAEVEGKVEALEDAAPNDDIELRNNGTHLQWKYTGGDDSTWVNLVAVEDLAGLVGPAGPTPTFRVDSGNIEYKYPNDANWTVLIALSALEGPQGPAGTDLSTQVSALQTALASKVDKNFRNTVFPLPGDNWQILAIEVLPNNSDPTKKVDVNAYFADALTNATKTEVFTLELGNDLEFAAGSTPNSIKINYVK